MFEGTQPIVFYKTGSISVEEYTQIILACTCGLSRILQTEASLDAIAQKYGIDLNPTKQHRS